MKKMNCRRSLSLILAVCLLAFPLNALTYANSYSTQVEALEFDFDFNEFARGPSKVTMNPYDISNNNVTYMQIVLRFTYWADVNGNRVFDLSVPLTYEYEFTDSRYSNAIISFSYSGHNQLDYTITSTRSPGNVTVYGSGYYCWVGTTLTRITTYPL